MDIEEALSKVTKKINALDLYWPDKPSLVVQNTATIERPWGWVFFYNTEHYLDSGNTHEALVGNAPIVVNRYTGEMLETGTAHPIEHYIEQYEQKLNRSE